MAQAPRVVLDSAAPDTIDGPYLRALTFQRARRDYLRRTVAATGTDPRNARALVVGGGRGPLAADVAALGFSVTAVDRSAAATELAARFADPDGPDIDRRTAPPEALPVPDASVDLAYYADTFETTDRLAPVLAEAARVLVGGGVLVYDTVTRTALSRVVYLVMFQALPATRIVPSGHYRARRLRRPDELARALRAHGLHDSDVCGFNPDDPRDLLGAVRARRRGEITDAQVPERVAFSLQPEAAPKVTYLGYARRA